MRVIKGAKKSHDSDDTGLMHKQFGLIMEIKINIDINTMEYDRKMVSQIGRILMWIFLHRIKRHTKIYKWYF